MSHREIDPLDKNCFQEAMRGVTPLKHAHKITQRPNPEPRPKRQAIEPTKPSGLSSQYLETVGPETTLSFCVNNFPKKRFIELKQGRINIEARLDLHGLRISDAEIKLCQFIEAQTNQNRHCVLIIHGKGGDKNNEAPLKSHTAHWLKQLPILAFHSAQPKDGGNGALYVLLRRL